MHMAGAEEKAYEAIRSDIAAGRLKGGEHLSAAELAGRLDISRTPVREALRRLSAEGLVNFLPNRGAYVTTWMRQDVEEVFELRIMLEGHAAKRAATRFAPKQLARLNTVAGDIEDLAENQPAQYLDSIAAANGEFHRLIVSAAASDRLAALIKGVVEMPLVVRTFHFYSADDLARSIAHHRELVAAFSRRDGDWAGNVMRSHIRAAYHVFVALAGVLVTADDEPTARADQTRGVEAE